MLIARLRVAVYSGIGLLMVMIVSVFGLFLESSYRSAWLNAENNLEQTASVAENIINRHFLQIDSALTSIPAMIAGHAKGSNGVITQDNAQNLLNSLNFQTFIFRDLMLVESEGQIWASARPRNRLQLFPIKLADGSLPPLGISSVLGPRRNVMTGQWSLYMVRPVTIPGVVPLYAIAEMPLTTLTTPLQPLVEHSGLKISLERPDTTLLAILPHDERLIGQLQSWREMVLVADGEAVVNRNGDQKEWKMLVQRKTLYKDIFVNLEQDSNSILADWRNYRNQLLPLASIGLLFALAVGIILLAALNRQERLEKERERAQKLLEESIAAMSDGFVIWDTEDRLLTCNEQFKQLYAVSASYMNPGASFRDLMYIGVANGQYPQAAEDPDRFVQETIAWHLRGEGSIERLLPDGRWLLITERRMASGGIVGIRTDISKIKQTQSELAEANEQVRHTMAEMKNQNAALLERDIALRTKNFLFETALNNMSHGLLMVDAHDRIIVCNHRFAELLELSEKDIVQGAPLSEVGQHQVALHSSETFASDIELFRRYHHDYRNRHDSYSFTNLRGRVIHVTQRPMDDGGFVAIVEDVTDQYQAEQRIRFLAHHDALTSLPNRLQFRNELGRMFEMVRHNGSAVALLYLDLDGFKDINDTLGHSAGDMVLETVAERLRRCIHKNIVMARLGGDEFAVALSGQDIETKAVDLSHRILETIAEPLQLGGRSATIGISIGIAIASQIDECDVDTMLKNADMALYAAKASGRGMYRFFEPEMAIHLHTRIQIENDLKGAAERNEFELAYQPLFALKTQKIIGFEALIRWNHPSRGRVSPVDFIPLAEQTGIINEIGQWVLHRACADTALLPDDISVAINISPVQLKSSDFVEQVLSALLASGLMPHRLELEITETALLDDDERIMLHLHRLQALGIQIVLDDFGTGYSSLSYLRHFPFNKIKIDKVFVSEMSSRDDCYAIVRSIVNLAQSLGMRTTAEGIEIKEQLDLVNQCGCTEGQGYLLGKPLGILQTFPLLESTNRSMTEAAPQTKRKTPASWADLKLVRFIQDFRLPRSFKKELLSTCLEQTKRIWASISPTARQICPIVLSK